jgi:hypothetical protein
MHVCVRITVLHAFSVSSGNWFAILKAMFPPFMFLPCVRSFEMLVALTADIGRIYLRIPSSVPFTVMSERISALIAAIEDGTAPINQTQRLVPLPLYVRMLGLRPRRAYDFRRHGKRVKRIGGSRRLVVVGSNAGRFIVRDGFVVRSISGRNAVSGKVVGLVNLMVMLAV